MGEIYRVHPWQFNNAVVAVHVAQGKVKGQQDQVFRVSKINDENLRPEVEALALMYVGRLWGMRARELTPTERRALANLNPHPRKRT